MIYFFPTGSRRRREKNKSNKTNQAKKFNSSIYIYIHVLYVLLVYTNTAFTQSYDDSCKTACKLSVTFSNLQSRLPSFMVVLNAAFAPDSPNRNKSGYLIGLSISPVDQPCNVVQFYYFTHWLRGTSGMKGRDVLLLNCL